MFLILFFYLLQFLLGNVIPSVEIKGNQFISNDERFFIKGVAYQKMRQPGDVGDDEYTDAIANTKACMRDIEYLDQLGVNVIRVYQIDPTKNHDVCMNALAAKGIYVVCDLSEPQTSIKRDLPSWDVDLKDRYFSVIDSMSKYKNILGFISGNEVTNTKDNIDAAAFVKASIRDCKNYIKQKGYRTIPVGYASNDDPDVRFHMAQYLVSGNSEETVDFYGLNMYEWCGYSTYATSGYRERTMEFSSVSVPVFFTEFGCNNVSPRPFTEVEALFGPTMAQVWSGGIAYEYFQHYNNYGLVEQTSNDEIIPLEDFTVLSMRFQQAQPNKEVKPQYKPITNITCKETPKWPASCDVPPSPDRGKCECMQSTLSCISSPFKEFDHGELFREICSQIDCHEVEAFGDKGIYGIYSDCSDSHKLSFVLDKYYKSQNRKSGACDLNSRAILITNNDDNDLNGIRLRDGRLCKEVLGNAISSAKHIQSSKFKPGMDKSSYRGEKNRTEIMKSKGGGRIGSGIVFVTAIVFVVSVFVIV